MTGWSLKGCLHLRSPNRHLLSCQIQSLAQGGRRPRISMPCCAVTLHVSNGDMMAQQEHEGYNMKPNLWQVMRQHLPRNTRWNLVSGTALGYMRSWGPYGHCTKWALHRPYGCGSPTQCTGPPSREGGSHLACGLQQQRCWTCGDMDKCMSI